MPCSSGLQFLLKSQLILFAFHLLLSYSLYINFFHFNYNVSWLGPFRFMGLDSVFLASGCLFLSQVREVFQLLFLQISSLPLSPLSPSFWDPVMWMLMCLMLSQRSHKLIFKFFFFSVWIGWFPLPSSSLLICSPVSFNLFYLIYCILQLCLVLLYIFSLLIFSLCSPILLLSWNIFMIIILIPYWVVCLSPFHLILLGFHVVPLFGTIPLSPHFA